jgi:hypothetical protein
MAKRDRFYPDRSITLEVNDTLLEYLEDLAKTGLYGNTYPQAAEIVMRHGLRQLIDAGVLKIKERPFKDEES